MGSAASAHCRCSDARLVGDIDTFCLSLVLDKFYQHGYIVVPSLLSPDALDMLHDCHLRSSHWRIGNPCSRRWSCTNPCNNHGDDRWRVIWEAPLAARMLMMASKFCELPMCIGSAGGDLVQPGAQAQSLHSDWPRYSARSMKWGFILAVSVAVTDHEESGGLLRLGSWSDLPTHEYPDLPLESVDLCECLHMKRGDMLIRDVRVCHGGSAHAGQFDRPLPCVQIYCTSCCQGTCFDHARINGCEPFVQ